MLFTYKVLMLVRHVIESIDGVSILVNKGCAENCGPLLRSAFEGQLGVLYILQTDNKRRALAYHVAHAHRQITLYRKLNPNDALGKQLRSELKDDPMADIFDQIPVDLRVMVDNLQEMFLEPEFVPIETEWQAIRQRTKKDPQWFALFGGPRDVRSLALSLKLGAAYEGLYRSWSSVIHAGSGLSHIGPSDLPGVVAVRPIRHPEGLQTACNIAANTCLNTARNLLQAYAPDEWEGFRQTYMQQIAPRYMELCKTKLIHAPWKQMASRRAER